MTTLIVFDIDGTLLRSVPAHVAAFVAALRESGLTEIDSNWGGYTHHTDSWIFREVFRRNTGRLPGEAETKRFSGLLHEHFTAATAREGVEQTPGPPRSCGRWTRTPGTRWPSRPARCGRSPRPSWLPWR